MSQEGHDKQIDSEGVILADSLLVRCQTLLNELDQFGRFIENRRSAEREHTIEIRKFQSSVTTEFKSLQKLSDADLTAEKTVHTLRSSNLPFYAAIWEAAKATKALVTFNKRFYWDNQPTRHAKKAAEKRCALVDIVASGGEEWIKVSTITEERLKFEVAKAQWEAADSSPSEEEDTENGTHANKEEDYIQRIELVQTANDLVRASKAHRFHYKHPQVRFVLPKISASTPPELLPVMDRVRSIGIVIDLGPQPVSAGDLSAEVFPNLLPSPYPPLTSTLNIDCTILLALVSDLSHTANHPILPGYNAAITRQIELETQNHLLPSSLWPAMADKELICTQEAAKRMREIVDTIGMPNERLRTELLLPDGRINDDHHGGEGLRQEFAKYSDYKIPSSWRLPIRIVDAAVPDSDIQTAIQDSRLPPVAKEVAEQLTDINRSVFIYGWIHGITTVSSNRSVAKQIESIVEKDEQGAMGPDIWLREPARSLLGKEKERRK
ncbi:hypothetical protein ACLMJK_000898 [Lecanora helva]